MALASAEYTGDAVHLLRLIESQPSCVMRVGVDGTLLAVNDAALKLLGAPGLETVLGTSLSDRLASRSGPVWQEFVSRLQGGASSSVECALTQGSGERTILFQGVPLLDHPDQIPSIILAARDVTAVQRIEAAVVEQDLSRQVDLAVIEHGFAAQLEGLRGELARTAAEAVDLQAALSAKDEDAERRAAEYAVALAKAVAEAGQARSTLAVHDQETVRLLAEQSGEHAQQRKTLDEKHARALAQVESQRLEREASVRLASEAAQAEKRVLSERLAESQSALERLVAEHATALEGVETALAARQHGTLAEERARQAEIQAKLEQALQAKLEQALQEGLTLGRMLEESERESQRVQQAMSEEHQLALMLQEREARRRLDDLTQKLQAATAERERLSAAVAASDASRRAATAEYEAARAGADVALAAAVEQSERLAQALAAHRAELQMSEEGARLLEPLAAAGRLALDVAQELQEVMTALDGRTKRFLATASVPPGDRDAVESIRRDAVRAGSLARQVVQAPEAGPQTAVRTTVPTSETGRIV